MVETAQRLLPVVVKASERAGVRDARGLEAFVDEHEDLADGGPLLYAGQEVLPLARRVLAAPWWAVCRAGSVTAGSPVPGLRQNAAMPSGRTAGLEAKRLCKLPRLRAKYHAPNCPASVESGTDLPEHRLGQDPDLPHQGHHQDPHQPPEPASQLGVQGRHLTAQLVLHRADLVAELSLHLVDPAA